MLLMLHYCSSSLLLVLEFESGRGEILNLYEYLYAKKKKRDQFVERGRSVGRHNSTGVDVGRKI